MKVQIKGYQSVQEQVEFEVNGLTVITGESNVGKSALVRAVTGLLRNQKGSDFITKGLEQARVSVEVNDHKAVWIKGRTTQYCIDGEEHKKAGKSTPPELSRLGFFEVRAGDRSYYPQVQRQFDPPFIVSESSPIAAADLLASNKYSQQLALAVKLAQRETAQEAANLKALEGMTADLRQVLINSRPHREVLTRRKESVAKLDFDRNLVAVRVTEIQRLEQSWKKIEVKRDILALRPVDDLPEIPRIDRYRVIRRLEARYSFIKRIQGLHLREEAPQIPQERLTQLLKLREIGQKWEPLYKKHAVVLSFKDKELKELQEIQQLFKRVRCWDRLQRARKSCAQERELVLGETGRVESELSGVQKEITTAITELGKCPLCGEAKKSRE